MQENLSDKKSGDKNPSDIFKSDAIYYKTINKLCKKHEIYYPGISTFLKYLFSFASLSVTNRDDSRCGTWQDISVHEEGIDRRLLESIMNKIKVYLKSKQDESINIYDSMCDILCVFNDLYSYELSLQFNKVKSQKPNIPSSSSFSYSRSSDNFKTALVRLKSVGP